MHRSLIVHTQTANAERGGPYSAVLRYRKGGGEAVFFRTVIIQWTGVGSSTPLEKIGLHKIMGKMLGFFHKKVLKTLF